MRKERENKACPAFQKREGSGRDLDIQKEVGNFREARG